MAWRVVALWYKKRGSVNYTRSWNTRSLQMHHMCGDLCCRCCGSYMLAYMGLRGVWTSSGKLNTVVNKDINGSRNLSPAGDVRVFWMLQIYMWLVLSEEALSKYFLPVTAGHMLLARWTISVTQESWVSSYVSLIRNYFIGNAGII